MFVIEQYLLQQFCLISIYCHLLYRTEIKVMVVQRLINHHFLCLTAWGPQHEWTIWVNICDNFEFWDFSQSWKLAKIKSSWEFPDLWLSLVGTETEIVNIFLLTLTKSQWTFPIPVLHVFVLRNFMYIDWYISLYQRNFILSCLQLFLPVMWTLKILTLFMLNFWSRLALLWVWKFPVVNYRGFRLKVESHVNKHFSYRMKHIYQHHLQKIAQKILVLKYFSNFGEKKMSQVVTLLQFC